MTLEEAQQLTSPTLTITQGAALLRPEGGTLDERTVLRGCREGQIPSIVVGRRRLILRLPLLAMLGADGLGGGDAT